MSFLLFVLVLLGGSVSTLDELALNGAFLGPHAFGIEQCIVPGVECATEVSGEECGCSDVADGCEGTAACEEVVAIPAETVGETLIASAVGEYYPVGSFAGGSAGGYVGGGGGFAGAAGRSGGFLPFGLFGLGALAAGGGSGTQQILYPSLTVPPFQAPSAGTGGSSPNPANPSNPIGPPPVNVIPEPSTLALAISAMPAAGLWWRRRRASVRRRQEASGSFEFAETAGAVDPDASIPHPPPLSPLEDSRGEGTVARLSEAICAFKEPSRSDGNCLKSTRLQLRGFAVAKLARVWGSIDTRPKSWRHRLRKRRLRLRGMSS